jgi:alpha-N-acetylglucosaminidase
VVEQVAADGPLDNQILERFLAVFTDLDRLLATRPELTLVRWESQAESWATGPEDRRLLLDNARRILTVWNVSDTDLLDDYAGRIWAGLIGGYYRRRWEAWARGLNRSTLADPHAAERALTRRLQACAEDFLARGAPVVHGGLGEVAAESRRLFARYGAVLAGLRGSATERERAHGRTS